MSEQGATHKMIAKELHAWSEAEIEVDRDGLHIADSSFERTFSFPTDEARRIRDWLVEVLRDE